MREAKCACGDLSLTLEGEPLLVSACGCTRCQRRTGSFFGVTAYFDSAQVVARTGEPRIFRRAEGAALMRFCPRCGTSLWWELRDGDEDYFGVAGGCFADPTLPGPHRLTHAATAHPFVTAPPGVPVYEDGPPES